jgi:hypothetical protein
MKGASRKVLKTAGGVRCTLPLPDGKHALATFSHNHQIWLLNLESGEREVYAGMTSKGYRDGMSDVAQFDHPWYLALKSDGSVVVGDWKNHAIREISKCGKYVATIAGLESPRDGGGRIIGGHRDGAAITARFNSPSQICVGPDDSIYLADWENHCIRKIAKGQVSTIAGRGGVEGYKDGVSSEALFNRPHGIAIDMEGNLYVSDLLNKLIRKIDTEAGIVSTITGQQGVNRREDGDFNTATFFDPYDIIIDGEGNLNIADNNSVRYVNLTSQSVHTITGHEESHLLGDDINSPQIITCLSSSLDLNGNIIIADINKSRLLLVPHKGGLSITAQRLYEGLTPNNKPTLLEMDMKKMLTDATTYDSNVTIQVVDTTFNCHRNILMTRCDHFKGMFESKWLESKGGVIRIGGTTPLAFKSLLLYLYSGNLEDSVNEKVVIDLTELSSRYMLKDLEKYCLWFIQSNVCLSTGIPLLIWATDNGDMYSDLRAVLKEYVVANYKSIEELEGRDTLELMFKGHADLKEEIMSEVGKV